MVIDRLLRITQINAVYFDKEILNVLKQHVQECLKYLPPGLSAKYVSEVNLLLRLAILKYSLLSHGCTFGQKLLSIKYHQLSTTDKLWFLISPCFDYIQDKNYFNSYVHNVALFLQLLRLGNISLFLRGGEKPQLIERLLGLKQVYSQENVHRHYEDKYMTRELMWNGFIEVLVYMLPLINYHKITRTMRQLNPLNGKPVTAPRGGGGKLTLDCRCPHCGEYPVHPVHMGCEHVFCFSCLKGNQTADPKYECPLCEYSSDNVMCEKVYGDS